MGGLLYPIEQCRDDKVKPTTKKAEYFRDILRGPPRRVELQLSGV